MTYSLGFDLGATNIKWVAITPKGRLLDKGTFTTKDDPTRRKATKSALWAGAIRNHIHTCEEQQGKSPTHVGLSAPGLTAANGRSIAHMPGRLMGLEGLDWTEFLESPQVVPILNDAHAALIGEAWRGAAAGIRNVILLTLGTGVGGAAMEGGRLLRGAIGRAGHLGHICLNPLGEPDVTGIPGSLEDAIGECTLEKRSEGRFRSTRALVQAHLAGDQAASVVWLSSVYCLACAIASFINLFDPEVVVIGGGIAQAGPALFGPLDDLLDKVEWRPAGERVKIVPAKLGSYAGAIGAARNAMVQARRQL